MWLVLLAAMVAVSAGGTAEPRFLIVPGGKSGAITVQTAEADLVRTYGRQNVTWGDVDVGEGHSKPGTILFQGDSSKKLAILWRGADRQGPRQIRVSGKQSLWKTTYGITLGTSLKQLERINRRPFLLAGFEWDYAGTVTSWREGLLEPEFTANGRVLLRLMPAPGTDFQELRPVLGSRDYSSGHPVMQKLDPIVYEIIWEFE